jgi:hypothetical protein
MRALVLLAVALGCGGGAAEPDAAVASVVVTVERAEERTNLGELGPADMFAVIDVRIANRTASAVPVAPANFRLRTDEKLEIGPVDISPTPCPTDALLAPNGVLSCTVVFVLSRFVTPVAVVYASEDLETVTAIKFEPCERCSGDSCVDIKNDVENCGACDVRVPDHGVCTDGVPGCIGNERLCGGICVSSDVQCAMIVTTSARESCTDTCTKTGTTCSTENFNFPEARYVCANGDVELDGLLRCPDIPPATNDGCSFSVNRCLCL